MVSPRKGGLANICGFFGALSEGSIRCNPFMALYFLGEADVNFASCHVSAVIRASMS